MKKTVSITSQGQITIPAAIRRALDLDKYPKALVSRQGKKIIIEPSPDIMDLAGSLHKKALAEKDIQEVITLEEKAAAQGAVKKQSK